MAEAVDNTEIEQSSDADQEGNATQPGIPDPDAEREAYERAIENYRKEINEAKNAGVPDELIKDARKNLSSVRRAMKNLDAARADEDAGITDQEYIRITNKYTKDLKENYSFLNRAKALVKYVGARIYNALTFESKEIRKEQLQEDLEYDQKVLEGLQNKQQSYLAKINKKAEDRINTENKKRKMLGKKPLMITDVNLKRYYSGREERKLAKLSDQVKSASESIKENQTTIRDIETELESRSSKAADLYATFRGKGSKQKELDEKIKDETDAVMESKTLNTQQKQTAFDISKKTFIDTIKEIRSCLNPEQPEMESEEQGSDETIENTISDQDMGKEAEKNEENSLSAAERASMARKIHTVFDDKRGGNEDFTRELALLSDNHLTQVHSIAKNKNLRKYIKPEIFRAAVSALCSNESNRIAEGPEDFANILTGCAVAQNVQSASFSSILHKENMKKEADKSSRDQSYPVGEVDFDEIAEPKILSYEEMSNEELNKALDKERKNTENLRKDLNRARNQLKKVEMKLEQNADMISPKLEAEYDKVNTIYQEAENAYNKANDAFGKMKKEKSSRSRAKREYLPESIEKKEMKPSKKAEKEKDDITK